MPFVPTDFTVPEKLVTPHFVARKLMFTDAELDYAAVMSSIDIIKATRGGDWPEPTLTYQDDQIDLAWHQREFEFHNQFPFTVLNPDETKCLGCFYFYPPGMRGETSKDADVDVSFWVTQESYDAGLYPILYHAIDNWLKTAWPWQKIAYTNIKLPELPKD
jgi:hypothetical protein